MEINKDLIKKAIDIKGKKYVLVSDRILAFNEMYEDASITTEYNYLSELNMFVVEAIVSCEKGMFVGHSQAVIGDGYINKTSALENAETSAVGRALAMMGIGVIDSVASVDEINKASYNDIKVNNKSKQENDLKKVRIGNYIKTEVINKGGTISTEEDYKIACLDLLNIELTESNYDKILLKINK